MPGFYGGTPENIVAQVPSGLERVQGYRKD